MSKTLYYATIFWLGLFELIAGLSGWWGLSWLGRGAPRVLLAAVPAWVLLRLRAAPGRSVLALLFTLPAALALQLAASSLRQRTLDPQRGLEPGTHDDRRVERIDIPLDTGHVPALHVVPAAGARVAVCVAHGSGCHKSFYAWRLVDALVARGLAVLLIDLDGHGENPRPQRFPDMLASVREPVVWLHQRYERVALIGFSLGACLAGRAVADGLAVDALALLEGPPRLAFGRRAMVREGLLLLRPTLYHVASDSSLYHIVRAWESAPIRAEISTWDLIDALDLAGSLARISAPLLLIYGRSDAIVPPAQGKQIRAAMPPHATFRWVAHGSHLSLILEPEMLRILGEWLEEGLRVS
jgi:pimeloyl-ACP methyl ester carboxylesterase